ncbi:IclR family transcriptional regulator [Miniphocaeibacter massiliensis]|uniref:IclR family transcriptional regulator n=1 Tax=Miniphocaeibacter massiliensis TaxID=2041841 RepID=UPI000C1BE958|nr:IclR family transcriptional regulator [Miniphocaeibacter massiliensis]
MAEIVQSIDRVFNILEVVANSIEGITIKEITEETKLHKSTVHRLLYSLIQKGYVVQDEATSKYNITFKLYELGMKKLENIDLVRVARPYVEELMNKVGEVVHLVIRDKNDVVYVDKVESKNTIRMYSTIGSRTPLYCSSVGKAILAYSNETDIEKVWNSSNIKKFTPTTIIDYEDFLEELVKIKRLGFAEDNEEHEEGVRCIGSPIFNINGNVEGAISVSGPSNRIIDSRINEIAENVKYYSKKISEELGYKI